jgi:RNA 3'-terminal phosphate cyclase (ATP)
MYGVLLHRVLDLHIIKMLEVVEVDGIFLEGGNQILKSCAVEVVKVDGNILEGGSQILMSCAVEVVEVDGNLLKADDQIIKSCAIEVVEVDGNILEGGSQILKSCAVEVVEFDGNCLEGGNQILKSCAVEVVEVDRNLSKADDQILKSCAIEVVEVDGNILEGGGQILRSCAAYAAILRKRVHFINIRANRPRPGLRPTHVEGLKLVATLTNGDLVGASEGSQDATYTPGQIICNDDDNDADSDDEFLKVELKTERVGASSLLVQGALPMLLFAPKSVELVLKLAGTKVFYEPPIDYMKHVLVPLLCTQFKVNVELEIVNRGYMPRGGGILTVKVADPTDSVLQPIQMLHRGALIKIVAKLCGFGRPAHAEFVDHVHEALLRKLREKGVEDEVLVEFVCEIDGMEMSEELECRLFLYAETAGGCVLSGASKGGCESTDPELLASQSVDQLVEQLSHGGCIDEYLQDQLIIFMSLAEGVSEILTGPITSHTETAIHFAHHMTQARIMVKPILGTPGNFIRCDNSRCQKIVL